MLNRLGGHIAERPDDKFLARVGGPRLSARQIDELMGFVRGIIADDVVSNAEVAALKSWLAINHGITQEPVLRDLAALASSFRARAIVASNSCITSWNLILASPKSLVPRVRCKLVLPAIFWSSFGTSFLAHHTDPRSDIPRGLAIFIPDSQHYFVAVPSRKPANCRCFLGSRALWCPRSDSNQHFREET
jgi:hypothetical protein